jgi:IclR family acetate operon transcriptional repressor
MAHQVKPAVPPETVSPRPRVRAVERALAILNCLVEQDLRLADLARRLELHKATVTRLLSSLVAAELVSKNHEGRYGLGPGIALLAARLGERHRSLVDFLREPLRRVWRATRETVVVHVRVGLVWIAIEELESPRAIKFKAGVGQRVPVHVGSAGRALLAFLPADELAAILRRIRFVGLTERTIVSRTRLAEELEKVRRVGHAISFGEGIIGAAAVSVPVFDAAGRPVAAVSVLGPDSRLPLAELRRCGSVLKEEIRPLPVVIPDPARSFRGHAEARERP